MKLPLLSTLTLTLTFTTAAFAAVAEPVAFESFTYTGRDTVFETPLPAGHFKTCHCEASGLWRMPKQSIWIATARFAHLAMTKLVLK